jgi:hypothetical protein
MFCDWCKIKNSKGLGIKVKVVVQVKKKKEKKKKKARTAALGGAEKLNKAQMIQKRLQSIKESDKQIIIVINKLQRNCIYC